jgi:hypothetical protein
MIQQTLRIASLTVLVLTSALTNLLQAQLSVSGTISSHNDTPRNVEVVVFQGNTEIHSVTPKRRGKYSTSLELGYVYTLEYREEGAVTKRVTLDTRTEGVTTEWAAALAAKSAEGELHYELDMTMHTLTPELAASDDFEFPVAVLKWHEDGQFGPERNYVRVAGMTYEKARLVGVVR